MKKLIKMSVAGLLAVSAASAIAAPATSAKHANKATEWRQNVYQLIYSNMAPLGAMAKGKMPMDAARVEKNAKRINQLSHMIGDYMAVDTRKFDVKTEALDKVWENPADFEKKIQAIIKASAALEVAAKGGNSGAIKKAIGGVGKSCKGCHDSYKMD